MPEQSDPSDPNDLYKPVKALEILEEKRMKTFIAQWKVDIVANNMFKSEQQQKPFADFKDAYIRGFKMGVDRTREVRDNTVKKIKNLEEENKTLYAQIDKLIEEIWELKAENDSLSELT